MTDLVTLVIDGAVAAGTLGATFLTVYQLRRDHRERLARELADKVYVPMLGQASAWQNPEPMYAGGTWNDLKGQVPYLTNRVPSKLVTMLDKADALNSEIDLYLISVAEVVGKSTKPGNPSIAIVTATASYGPIFDVFHLAIRLWKSKKPLAEYFKEYMRRNRPDVEDWHLELNLDGKTIDRPADVQGYLDR